MAYMNGIDISNWQKGINLSVVPADFVIMKATQGTWYVSPDCDKQYQQAKKAGRCLGVYHYAQGGNVQAEADYFLKNIQGYIGEAILILDWEGQDNPTFNTGCDNTWVKQWCDYVYSKTGVKPMVYIQKSALNRVSGIGDYGLWVAQYANNNPTGYQANPWNEGAYSCAMRQYSSTGRLSGYNGNLDLNKFYGDRTAWNKYAGKGNAIKPTAKWVHDNVGWWYRRADGSYPKSQWLLLDCYYYFNDKGYALANEWLDYGGNWYWLKDDCRMATGWQYIDKHWYYLNKTGTKNKPVGAMLDGWQYIDGQWYYLRTKAEEGHPHGSMVEGVVTFGNYDYYCREKGTNKNYPVGSMLIGWRGVTETEEDGTKKAKWFWYNKDSNCQPIGSMLKNHWLTTSNGKKYYLKDDGVMACDETMTISEKEYTFDASGALV